MLVSALWEGSAPADTSFVTPIIPSQRRRSSGNIEQRPHDITSCFNIHCAAHIANAYNAHAFPAHPVCCCQGRPPIHSTTYGRYTPLPGIKTSSFNDKARPLILRRADNYQCSTSDNLGPSPHITQNLAQSASHHSSWTHGVRLSNTTVIRGQTGVEALGDGICRGSVWTRSAGSHDAWQRE